MRYQVVAAMSALLLLAGGASCQKITDVPANHWASGSVQELVRAGVMEAPNGKFRGNEHITRREAVRALARYVRMVDKGKQLGIAPVALKAASPAQMKPDQPVSRYEFAYALARMAAFLQKGLPRPSGKIFGESEAIPPASATQTPKNEPAHADAAFLAKARMLWPKSPLLRADGTKLTGNDLAQILGQLVVGLIDRYTDEPQNRIDLGTDAPHRH